MLIRVRELELQKLEFNEHLPPGAVDFGPDFRQLGELHAEGRAELIVEHRGHRQDVEDIRLVGKLGTEIEVLCARCLDPVVHKVARDFDLLYRPQGVDGAGKRFPSTRPRPKSAIIRAKVFCWKTSCANRCCCRRRSRPCVAKIAKVCARAADAI